MRQGRATRSFLREEARRQAALARDTVDQRFKTQLDAGDGSAGCWYDWLFARIMVGEAERLIEG